MGLEDIAMFRAIHGSTVLYPCDAVSGERMVELAARTPGIVIVYIRTTRSNTPVIYPNNEEFHVGGCKVLRSSEHDQVTIATAGITVHEALKASEMLSKEKVSARVIDLYSVKPLDTQTLLRCASETNNMILTVEDHYYEGGIGDAVASELSPHGVHVHKLAVRDMPRSGKSQQLLEAYGIGVRAIFDMVMRLRGGAAGGGEGRVPLGRVVPTGRLHRHESYGFQPRGGAVLQ
jgi:transketolase